MRDILGASQCEMNIGARYCCREHDCAQNGRQHLGQLVVKDSQVATLDLVGMRLHLDDVRIAAAAASAQ